MQRGEMDLSHPPLVCCLFPFCRKKTEVVARIDAGEKSRENALSILVFFIGLKGSADGKVRFKDDQACVILFLKELER